MPLFKKKKKELDLPPEPQHKELHMVKKLYHVNGTPYYQENMMKLATPDPEYDSAKPVDGKIMQYFKYKFRDKPLSLDDDPYFDSCIRLQVDGIKVGLLSSDDSQELAQILQGEVKYIRLYIDDGPCKIVSPDGSVQVMDNYRIVARLSVGYMEET